ncbi:hypothetical protein NKH69_06625 [Mesorhizobium sp. M0976]|uniref:hypothetical protein n=1 Tax=unclassified Mesorhizobium TaxID=325217 RepID=UPI00333AADAE
MPIVLAAAMLHDARAIERRQQDEVVAVDQRHRVMRPEFRGSAGGNAEAGQRTHFHVDTRRCEWIELDLEDRAAVDLAHHLDAILLRKRVRHQPERGRRIHRHPQPESALICAEPPKTSIQGRLGRF